MPDARLAKCRAAYADEWTIPLPVKLHRHERNFYDGHRSEYVCRCGARVGFDDKESVLWPLEILV